MKTTIKLSALVILTLTTTNLYADNFYQDPYQTSPYYYNNDAPSEDKIITTTNEDVKDIILVNDNQREKKESRATNQTSFSSLVIMDSEKSTIKDNGVEGKATAFKINYDKELAPNQDVGVLFSYKNTTIDKFDGVNDVKSKNILLSPYFKYYHDINEKVDVMAVANIVTAFRSTELGANETNIVDYGLGLGVVPNYYVNDKLLFSMPIGIQTMKQHVTKEPAGSNLDEETISQLNYGLGGEYMIKPNWLVNADVIQTQKLGSSDVEKDNGLYYNLRTSYHGEGWDYTLGYKTVKNVDNYKEDTYMLSVGYNF
jgi:hypothetical protein